MPKHALDELDKKTIALIDGVAGEVRASIEKGTLPSIDMPVRNLCNVTYDKTKGYFELGGEHKTRTLTVGTARSFAQTLRMMAARGRWSRRTTSPPSARSTTSARTGATAASTSRRNPTPSWTTSRRMASVQGLSREQLALLSRRRTAARSPASSP